MIRALSIFAVTYALMNTQRSTFVRLDRAAAVIQRIRQLATKTDPQRARLDINDVLRDVVPLVRTEVLSHQASLRVDLASALPPVLGDRVQLQQVIINLVMNGIEAMAAVDDRSRGW